MPTQMPSSQDANFSADFKGFVWTLRVIAPDEGNYRIGLLQSPQDCAGLDVDPLLAELCDTAIDATLRTSITGIDDADPDSLANDILDRLICAGGYPDDGGDIVARWRHQLAEWICAQRAIASANA